MFVNLAERKYLFQSELFFHLLTIKNLKAQSSDLYHKYRSSNKEDPILSPRVPQTNVKKEIFYPVKIYYSHRIHQKLLSCSWLQN